jgi:hypothetical protein
LSSAKPETRHPTTNNSSRYTPGLPFFSTAIATVGAFVK